MGVFCWVSRLKAFGFNGCQAAPLYPTYEGRDQVISARRRSAPQTKRVGKGVIPSNSMGLAAGVGHFCHIKNS